jgi:hypothetical protein
MSDVQFYGSFIHRMWQTIDVHLLREHFAESIFFMHTQPPLYNILVGAVVKTFPEQYYFIFQVLNMSLTWATAILIYYTLCRLGVNKVMNLLVGIFFMISPAVILYENLNSYTIFTVFLISLLTYFLTCYLTESTLGSLSGVSSTALALVLTRSSFHLIWFAVLLILIWRRRDRRTMIISIVCFCIATGWYLKNFYLYGSFNASSWLGMSLARVVPTFTQIGKIGPFKALTEYDSSGLAQNPYPNVALLTQAKKLGTGYTNFNHYRYVSISSQFQKEVFASIATHPGPYLWGVGQSFVIYFNPATHAPFVNKNYVKLGAYSRWLSLNFADPGFYTRGSYSITGALPAFLLYISVLGLIVVNWRSGFFNHREKRLVVILLFILAYGMLVGNLIESGENNRFRFEIHTGFLTLLVLSLDRFFRNFRNSYGETIACKSNTFTFARH